jgi:hypothetical protein
MTPAGGYTYVTMNTGSQTSHVETDQTNTPTKSKVVDDIDGRIEPFGQVVIDVTGLVQLRDFEV